MEVNGFGNHEPSGRCAAGGVVDPALRSTQSLREGDDVKGRGTLGGESRGSTR